MDYRGSPRSIGASATRPTDPRRGSEKDSEHKDVRHEEKWHEHGGYEVRGALQAGCDPHAQVIGLIKRIEQIHGADDVEHHTMMVPNRLPSMAIAEACRNSAAGHVDAEAPTSCDVGSSISTFSHRMAGAFTPGADDVTLRRPRQTPFQFIAQAA
jgi:hypothetical protein